MRDPPSPSISPPRATSTAGGRPQPPLTHGSIGPRRVARQPAADDRPEMVGAYLEPGATLQLFGVPATELTDKTVRLDDVWGTGSRELLADASELDAMARVDRLEAELLASRPWFHPFILDVQQRAWSNRQDAEPASAPWAVD